eukprot:TRINITY_DN63233_c0_g1_i1.p1 TRINITY_DN63233_c0_g1~~TRINITY_DN63233_c0_g1_i1.p1  ORF type:complete len:336 (+),score=60.95 TRINITY_DN63233_c0_g1_i1:26-1009(+)
MSGAPSVFKEYTAVEDAFEEFLTTLTRIETSSREQLENFKQQRSVLKERMEACNTSPETGNTKQIKLNIGGKLFCTTENTLLKEKETFFWAMLRSGQWAPDENTGEYFVDRSPQLFGAILDYLRDGKFTPTFSNAEIDLLHSELDFYQIPLREPLRHLRWDSKACKNKCNIGMAFSNEDQQVQISCHSNVSRFLYTHPFEPNMDGWVRFTLTVTAAANGVGKATVYFGDWGVSLVFGDVLITGPRNGGSRGLVGFPAAGFPKDTHVPAVLEFGFCVNTKTSALQVYWPNGETKTFELAKPCPTLAYISSQSTSRATFGLEHARRYAD